ncbi:MFS transporter [Arthrobacter psychrolactophilus]|uniref:MFS transporter n=1 Tax=Arthrobacter psychrolactophilus TaxID=92442 RepID=A0A2V5IXG0_9MICC|nr:MFS transporter [Arthrobacter psychrolactophilus]PYI40302.1 MFS transporter [Arthrobacter psychrolactophilus]
MNRVNAWRNGVVTAYAGSGLVFATWVSRIPAIRDDLDLTPGQVGLMLLCMSLGSFISVAASGLIVLRLGSKLTTRIASVVQALGVIVMGLGATVFSDAIVVGAGLVLVGLGTGCWNTSSNIEGAAVERALGRHIMPRLHGAFSIGTVVGAGVGALAAAVHLPVAIHLSVVAIAVSTAVFIGAGHYQADKLGSNGLMVDVIEASAVPGTGPIPVVAQNGDHGQGARTNAALLEAERAAKAAKRDGKAKISAAWRDPRTLMLGALVLGLGLAEGAAGDWVALAMVDGHDSTAALGALGYGIFVSAMTIGRFAGTVVLDKFGRVIVLRVGASLAVIGLALFVFAPTAEIAMASLIFWGLGSALGFPVAMSAASDDPEHAAARVSVVSTVGYGAFLGGPPLLGLLAEHVGVLHSLLAVLIMLVIAFFLTPVVRRPAYLDSDEHALKG